MNNKYKITKISCDVAFSATALANNFAPLLFSTFQKAYELNVEAVAALFQSLHPAFLVVSVFPLALVMGVGGICLIKRTGKSR